MSSMRNAWQQYHWPLERPSVVHEVPQIYTSSMPRRTQLITKAWLILKSTDIDNFPSRETVQNEYERIITTLKNNWKEGCPQDHPDMLITRNTEQWSLYLKESSLTEECNLLAYVASTFNILNDIYCDCAWLKPDGSYGLTNKLYLWIRKNAQQRVCEVLKLNLNKDTSKETDHRTSMKNIN
jgi:hypothetical protein